MENGKGAWKQKEGVIKSKKQTGWDTVDHWHAQDGDLLSNDGLEKTKKRLDYNRDVCDALIVSRPWIDSSQKKGLVKSRLD